MAAVAVTSIACGRKVESSFDSIGYVNALLADSLSSLQGLAKSSAKQSGCISLIGDPKMCLEVSEKFMTSDEFDNIDGKAKPDGLPDFAGETVESVLDFANAPYEGYVSAADGKTFLRELAVRNALAALDTTCTANPYAASSRISKGSPKVLIICSPVLAEYGGDDVSSLFEKIDCNVPVIYSSDTSFSFTSACYNILRKMNWFTHDIAYPAAKVYMTVPSTDLPSRAYSGTGAFSDVYKYSRPAGSISPTFKTIIFNGRFIPESFSDTVAVIAPKTLDSYVRNQH